MSTACVRSVPVTHSRLQDAFGRGVHVGDVRTVGAMHADAAADRHVADDRIARNRRTALREPHEHVVDAGDADAAGATRASCGRRAAPDLRNVDDVVVLELVAQAVGDRLRGGVAEADRRVEIRRRRVVQRAAIRSINSPRAASVRTPARTSSCSSASWPASTFSSLRSLRNHCLILCFALDVLTIESQSSDGRPLDLLTRISQMSPFCSW